MYQASRNPFPCSNDNYMYTSSYTWWTISLYSYSNSRVVLRQFSKCNIVNDVANSVNAVRPDIYLDPNITLSGKGTSDDPYTINS